MEYTIHTKHYRGITFKFYLASRLHDLKCRNFSGDTSAAKLVWKNLDEEKLFSLREEQKKYIWCDDKIKDTPSFTQDWVTTFLDIGYSVGLLALGLSPWAYIKFTKSFEENLWLRPLKKISGKIGLEISKSVRSKYTGPGHGKPVPKSNPKISAANGSTSGYSTGLSAGAPPSARYVNGSSNKEIYLKILLALLAAYKNLLINFSMRIL